MTHRYWFPAKRYGWGWGPPVSWQGWAALASFAALVATGAFLFPPTVSPFRYGLWIAALAVALLLVCWIKGEPPRWRWGGKT